MSTSRNGEEPPCPRSLSQLEALEAPGSAICREPGGDSWLLFSSPLRTLEALRVEEVKAAFDEAESEAAKGRWAAGFVSYDAAPAFDAAMKAKPPSSEAPLAYFAIYDAPFARLESFAGLAAPGGLPESLRPETSKELHCERVEAVQAAIDRGDCYQVNLTLRLRGERGSASPASCFLQLASSHPAPFMAYFDTGRLQAVSLSPELFLERRGFALATEPMKGTARRKSGAREDEDAARWLANDEKNRAENLMIVDMARNDLGRICESGSVKAPELFKVLSYPTVHQMVSRVEGRLREGCGLFDIFRASFPPASITGAPKIMATEKIATLESSPRKLYTGCAGCVMPGGDFLFNVAIRTALFEGGRVELGVGGGIVADSTPEDEWDECLAKAAFLSHSRESFKLLETLLWRRGQGFAFLKEHAARLKASQAYFGWKTIEGAFEKALESLKLEEADARLARVRVLAEESGELRAEWQKLDGEGWGKEALKVLIQAARSDSARGLLRHKTTARSLYDEAFKKARAAGFDEALFLNEKGELTEGAISNAILKTSSGWKTPAPGCGLLEGVWRASMAKDLGCEEAEITLPELCEAEEILLGNSVRGAAKVDELWLEGEEPGSRPSLVWKAKMES